MVQEGSLSINTVERKGYKPVKVPESYVRQAESMKIRTPLTVLTTDDIVGRQVIPANEGAIRAIEWAWKKIMVAGMTGGKEKPPVHCFRSLMDGLAVTNGFYRDGEVYLNENLCSGDGNFVKVRQVALEELAHYITGANDNARDFQQWAFDFAVRSVMVADNELPPG